MTKLKLYMTKLEYMKEHKVKLEREMWVIAEVRGTIVKEYLWKK